MVPKGNHTLLRSAVRLGPHGANAAYQLVEFFWAVERVQRLRLHPDWKLITQLAVPALLALRALDTFHDRVGLETSCLATTYGCPQRQRHLPQHRPAKDNPLAFGRLAAANPPIGHDTKLNLWLYLVIPSKPSRVV